jgi:hypothetical protein
VSPEIQYSTVLDAIVFYVGKRKRAAETDDSEKREMEEIANQMAEEQKRKREERDGRDLRACMEEFGGCWLVLFVGGREQVVVILLCNGG